MTPEIRLIFTDNTGHQTEQVYHFDGQWETLDQIEQAVEGFKQQALPQVEKALLERAQNDFIAQEKKTLVAG